MLYFQIPLIYRLDSAEPTIEETKSLAITYLNRCIKTRTLVEEDQNGIFTFHSTEDVKKVIVRSQNHLPKTLVDKRPVETISIKPSLFRYVMNYSGILGYYNPFTAEAQFNEELPPSYVPFTIAHEASHQLGYAREDEANFVGFLIGNRSQNSSLRYSTEYFALKSLLNALSDSEPEFVEKVLQSFSDGMKRDRDEEIRFREQHTGILDAFFQVSNDWFLKSNQQDGSVTYSYFTDLLIRYERGIKKNRVSQRDSKNTNDEKKFIAFKLYLAF